MGCNASRTAVVAPLQAPCQPPEEDITSSRTSLTGSRRSVKVRPRKAQSSDTLQSNSTSTLCSKAEYDPQASDVTSMGSRNSSASSGKSKASASSGDSGLGEENGAEQSNEPSKENNRIADKTSSSICDNSDNRSIGSNGSQSSEKPRPNGQRNVKFAEKLISELPDSPSILKRPASRGGMAFDVVVEDTLSPRMPLISSSTKRRKRPSYQELQEKQKVVEQRKKVSN